MFDVPRLRVALAVAGMPQARAIKAVERLDPLRNANPPSTVRTAFQNAAAAGMWPAAWRALTGLNMYEMLRAFDAIGDAQRARLWDNKPAEDVSRAGYAKSVVEDRQYPLALPATTHSPGIWRMPPTILPSSCSMWPQR